MAAIQRRGNEYQKTWAEMIRWLAERHHGGHIYPIAARVQVSAGLVDQWAKGIVKTPSFESVTKVCAAYGLELLLMMHFAAPPAMRKHMAPKPPRRPKKAPLSGGSGAALPLPVEESDPARTNAMPLIGPTRKPLHKVWGASAFYSRQRAA